MKVRDLLVWLVGGGRGRWCAVVVPVKRVATPSTLCAGENGAGGRYVCLVVVSPSLCLFVVAFFVLVMQGAAWPSLAGGKPQTFLVSSFGV